MPLFPFLLLPVRRKAYPYRFYSGALSVPIFTRRLQFREQAPSGRITPKNVAQASSKTLFPGSESIAENLVFTTSDVAERFCKWLSSEPETKGWLREHHYYLPSAAASLLRDIESVSLYDPVD